MEDVKEKAKRYLDVTRLALERVEVVPPPKSELRRIANLLLDMAQRYFSDALHFYEKGDYATALASVSYAHAWIDVGVVLGLLKGEDPKIFMVEP